MLFTDANTDMEPGSSPDSDLDAANTPEGADANADSSNAGATEDTTLSIVEDVVKEQRGESEAASPAEGQEGEPQPGGQNAQAEPDDENFTDVPFHKHPRFQQLLKERNSFKTEAAQFQNVQKFMDTNGISSEEAAEGFTIMALMRSNPQKAWEMLKPHVQNLLVAAGEVLPDDLAQRVQAGELSPAAAFEVSRSRALVQTVQTNQSFQEQQAERQRQMEQAQSLYNTASDWQADRERKDPNFKAKFPLLQREIAFLQMQEGKPTTPQGVKDQLERAYKAVQLPAPASPSRPTTSVNRPSASGQGSGSNQPRPQTTLDIIRQVKGAA